MNYSMVLYILGYILKFESAFLMLPALVSLLYQERAGIPFVITAAICLVLGIVFTHKKPSSSTVYTREGFVTVALSWIVMSIFGAIPFVWNGDIPYYVDALFETVSGFTTTGSSILSDVESLSHASLFWRSFSHWIGGMGVFVFIMSILRDLPSAVWFRTSRIPRKYYTAFTLPSRSLRLSFCVRSACRCLSLF